MYLNISLNNQDVSTIQNVFVRSACYLTGSKSYLHNLLTNKVKHDSSPLTNTQEWNPYIE